MRILIVDDDMTRRRAIGEALRERIGKQPEIWMAQSAQEARIILGYLRAEKWDVLFLDHDLLGSDWPESADGRTVARAIVEMKVKAKRIVIQSVNTWGAAEMKRILGKRRVTLAPYPECLDVIEQMDFDSTQTPVTT
jgi:CheY-like chemotaxis protein